MELIQVSTVLSTCAGLATTVPFTFLQPYYVGDENAFAKQLDLPKGSLLLDKTWVPQHHFNSEFSICAVQKNLPKKCRASSNMYPFELLCKNRNFNNLTYSVY
jgi:hypothetical protein